MKYKRTISVMFFALLFLLLVLLLLTIYDKKELPKLQPPEISTGAMVETPNARQLEWIKSRLALERLFPVRENNFEIDNDFQNDKYKVKLLKPYEQAKLDFKQWIKEHGFESLPRDDFEFVVE